MSNDDELWDIFYGEIDSDIRTLERLIANLDYSSLKAFAHKYKVRLKHLGFTETYKLCLYMEDSFAAEDYSTLMEHAKSLTNQLRSISKCVD